jgi:hypothetical protein
VLRHDNPTSLVVEPEFLLDFQRNLDLSPHPKKQKLAYRSHFNRIGSRYKSGTGFSASTNDHYRFSVKRTTRLQHAAHCRRPAQPRDK